MRANATAGGFGAAVSTAALRRGVALVAAAAADRLDLAGPDAARFLHNLSTADVRALAPGDSARGFLTSVKGRTLADFDLLALDGRLALRLPPGRAGAIAEHLSGHRIMERVEVEPRPRSRIAELRGERAPELLAALGIEPPGPGDQLGAELAGCAFRVRRSPRGREPRYELWFDAEGEGALARLRSAGTALGLIEPDRATLETARVEDGELAWGIDYADDAFPQETGEEGAVSWTKGCYLGQEVVARIRYRGAVQRVPRGLRFPDGPPEPGTALLHEGREAGRATSVCRSSAHGAIGLALVHRRAGEPPARLELAGGGAAELASLPFATEDS